MPLTLFLHFFLSIFGRSWRQAPEEWTHIYPGSADPGITGVTLTGCGEGNEQFRYFPLDASLCSNPVGSASFS